MRGHGKESLEIGYQTTMLGKTGTDKLKEKNDLLRMKTTTWTNEKKYGMGDEIWHGDGRSI